MSFFGSIKTFAEKFEAEFVRLFKKAPSYEQKAAAVISFIAPVIPIIVGLLDPAALPIVNPIIAVVEKDLGVVQAVTTSVSAAPGSPALTQVETALTGISENFGGILQLAEVKNSAKASQINTEVTGVLNEVNALLKDLPTSAPAAS